MAILLKQIFAFFKLLNSDKGTNQIAAGFACGMILGFSPVFSLQTALVIILVFLFRIQAGAAFLSAPLFAIPAYLLDPLFHAVGTMILETPALQGLFTALYHMPIIPFTRFNNTVVMGSGVVAIVLSPVVFLASKTLVEKYRKKVVSRFEQTRLWKAWHASTLYQAYLKYEALRG